MCLGILGFQKKYDTNTLEETCRQALDYDRATYTFIKNTIPVVAQDMEDKRKDESASSRMSAERGGYVMDSKASDLKHLLSKRKRLANTQRKEDHLR